MSTRPPLRPDMTVRQIAADYPDCRDVLRRYGEADRPGIKFGHLEPLNRFALRQGVDCGRLLQELAAAANVATAPDGSLDRNVHRPFIALALATTFTLGAGWGAWLLWQIGRARSFDAAAAGSIVAHGEAQLWGFIAVFVIGIALRYLPVATSRSAVSRRLARLIWAFLLCGIAGGFVWSLSPRFATWLGPLSGGSLAAAALLYLGVAVACVFKRIRSTWPRFVIASAAWLCVWSLYTCCLRANFAAVGPGEFTEAVRLRLLELAVFGFAMNAIYGFGLRLLPGFLSLGSPSGAPIEAAFWLHNLATAAVIAVGQTPLPRAVGAGAIAASAVFYALGMRGFRSRRPAARGDQAAARPEIGERFLRRYMQLAFVWLLMSLAMLAAGGARAAWLHGAASHAFVGAARHALTVGFMTTLILGVAQRLLPVLGQTLLAWSPLVRPIFALIAVGNLLRVVSELATAYWPLAYRVMPVSAVFELTALALFAANCLRTMWPRRDALLRTGAVTAASSLKTLLSERPQIEEALVGWGFGYVARVRAVPNELTIGSFAAGEGQDPAAAVERINAWLAKSSP